MYRRNPVRTLLTIAGSDNTGGAGIQADIKTCCAFRVYASTVITAVTAQTSERVKSIESVSPEMIGAQLDSIFECMSPDAVKIGMLPNSEIVGIVSRKLSEYHAHNIVLDPVLFASTGDSLTGETEETLGTMKEQLFPLITLLTPNLAECYRIIGEEIDEMEELAIRIRSHSGSAAVLVKGGHAGGKESTDIMYNGNDFYRYHQSRINTPNTHGTGCVLSTAIACGLAKGMTLPKSVRMAKDFITHALQNSIEMNVCRGRGPLYIFNN